MNKALLFIKEAPAEVLREILYNLIEYSQDPAVLYFIKEVQK